MTIADTIISFAVKKVLDKAIGSPTSFITNYYKAHVVLLYRVITAAARDGNIQQDINKIQDNLVALSKTGQTILNAIPPKPEPPSEEIGALFDKNRSAAFSKVIAAFRAGVENVLERLREYDQSVRKLEDKTDRELDDLKKRLESERSSAKGLRAISLASRLEDVEYLQIRGMEDIRRVRGQFDSRIKSYTSY